MFSLESFKRELKQQIRIMREGDLTIQENKIWDDEYCHQHSCKKNVDIILSLQKQIIESETVYLVVYVDLTELCSKSVIGVFETLQLAQRTKDTYKGDPDEYYSVEIQEIKINDIDPSFKDCFN